MHQKSHKLQRVALTALAAISFAGGAAADDSTLKVYMLLGQSNMDGKVFTWSNFATGEINTNNPTKAGWNIPTLDYFTQNQAYRDSLPNDVYSFKESFDSTWIDTPRNDAWAVSYTSSTGAVNEVRNVRDTTPGDSATPVYPTGIQPLSVGFGGIPDLGVTPSQVGIELSMGHNLGNAMNSPLLLFKSSKGGTTLAEDWRPPSAVTQRGGTVGNNYTNTMARFVEFLDGLDQDIANGVLDDKYDGATGYEVAGLVWLQGFNEVVENGGAFIPEYDQNLVDFVNDIRAHDSRIPNALPVVIAESSDQSEALNVERQAAVDAINLANPDTAVFIETNGLRDVNYGGLNPEGNLFTDGFGFHFHNRPENFLEIGWKVGDAILENGFTGSETVPDPASLTLLAMGALLLMRRR